MTLVRIDLKPVTPKAKTLYLITGHMEGEETLASVVVIAEDKKHAAHQFGQEVFNASGKPNGNYGMCIHDLDVMGEVVEPVKPASRFPWAHLWGGLLTAVLVHMAMHGGWPA